jgi:diguanylate cyclase (GGDEF)-like protein
MDWAAISRRTHLPAYLAARTWTLALLQGTSALGLVAMAAAPLGGAAPTALYAACGIALALSAVGLLAFGARVGDGTLLALAALRVAVAAVAIATGHSGGATLFGGAGLIWVALWVTAFFRPRIVMLTVGAEIVAVGAAVVTNSDHVRTALDTLPMLSGAGILSVLLAQVLGSLRHEARHDLLTGLLNRRGLDQALRELSGGRRFACTTSLVAIDLDGLKAVNDEAGHLAGDQMLVAFATELQTAVRGVDLVARIGGDEFIAILPGNTAAEATLWAAELSDRSQVAWSFGVAERVAGESFLSWLDRADERMYTAKAATRARRSRQTAPALARVTPAI